MKLRVACDTNVLVSALIADGPPSRVIAEVINGELEMVLLEPVLVELIDVLGRKLEFDTAACDEVAALMADIASSVSSTPEDPVEAVTGDPDDDLVLATAVAAGVDVLVSGDRKHLVPLGSHSGLRILTPQALLAELRA